MTSVRARFGIGTAIIDRRGVARALDDVVRAHKTRSAVLLLACLLWLPGAYAATYSGGTGAEGDPYLVSSQADLVAISDPANSADWSKCFLMTQDVDMSGVTTFSPIGNYTTRFTGVFNGDGHAVLNLTIDLPAQDNVGLFGYIAGASCRIEKLGVRSATVKGYDYVGGLVGMAAEPSVLESECAVTECYANAVAITGRNRIGGLIGEMRGRMASCYATGTVTGEAVGGLVGSLYFGSVRDSYSAATVRGSALSGGAGPFLGGSLVGMLYEGSVEACYSIGTVSGDGLGGLIGILDNLSANSMVKSSFWERDAAGRLGSVGGKALNATQMKSLTIYRNAGWQGHDWVMEDGAYPRLCWEGTGAAPIPGPDPVPLSGSGTEADPYRVTTVAEFAQLSWHASILDKHLSLQTDLDCVGTDLYPIGDLGPFTGFFHGCNHVLRNVTIEQPRNTWVGIFGAVGQNGSVVDLAAESIYVTGREYVGGLAGQVHGSTVVNCSTRGVVTGTGEVGGLIGSLAGDSGQTVTSCYTDCAVTAGGGNIGGLIGWAGSPSSVTSCRASGPVNGGSYIGGLVGRTDHNTVSACHATGDVTGSGYVGGLAGDVYGATLIECYATGKVTGDASVGGLAGQGFTSLRCFATGPVTGNNYVGGLVGQVGMDVTQCFASGCVTGKDEVGGLAGRNYFGSIKESYAVGAVVGNTNIGGLLGFDYYADPTRTKRCFWDATLGGPDNGYGTGLSTAQMKQRLSFESAGWSFTATPPVWYMAENLTYPQLSGIPMPVESVSALQALATVGNGSFYLTRDIDARETSDWTNGGAGGKAPNPGFLPIGTLASPFNGTLDGRGHRVFGLHVYRPTSDGVGLFGCIGADGIVRNIGLDEVTVTGGNQTGGLVGANLGSIDRCYVRGSVVGLNSVGGLVGDNSGVVTEAYAAAAVTGAAPGGLIGVGNTATVIRSFWDVEVSGSVLSAGGVGLATEAMMNSAAYNGAGWDLAATWAIAEELSYPYFQTSTPLRIVAAPPALLDADQVDVVVEPLIRGLFVTIGGGAYPAYAKITAAGPATISVPLKQEAINRLVVSAISETGVETVFARYEIYESSQFPSVTTAVTALAIQPTSVALAAKATQQFYCTATFADGTTADVTPITNWNVSGGTITAAGLYTHEAANGTVQALLHTDTGWQYSLPATISTSTKKGEDKAGPGEVTGVVWSQYTGLGLPTGRVTAYNLFTPSVAGQFPVHDTLGNFAFFMPEGRYHIEASCSGYRSALLRGGSVLEPRTMISPGPPAQYSDTYYSGQVRGDRPLACNFSLRPNDTGAPWVVFIEPVADTIVNSDRIVVTAIDADQYSELAVAKYAHNAQEYAIPDKISSTGFYRATWPLQLGINVLHLHTVDTAGNASQKTIQITYNPAYTGVGGDSDADGMPDAWETSHGLNAQSAVGIDGADGDLDGDGLSNLYEYQRGMLPNSPRSDSDDLTDGFEVSLGTNPLEADTDGDGIDDDEEWRLGSNPNGDDRVKTVVTNLRDGVSLRGNAVTLLAEVAPGYDRAAVAAVRFEVRGDGTGGGLGG